MGTANEFAQSLHSADSCAEISDQSCWGSTSGTWHVAWSFQVGKVILLSVQQLLHEAVIPSSGIRAFSIDKNKEIAEALALLSE